MVVLSLYKGYVLEIFSILKINNGNDLNFLHNSLVDGN